MPQPLTVTIRETEPTDLEAVQSLAHVAGLLEAGIAENFGRFLVAVHEGHVVGACGLEEYFGDGLLRTLVVEPESTRRRVGGKLVEAILQRARQRELRAVYLLTTTAAAYFVEYGFIVASRDEAPLAIRGSLEFKACPAMAKFMKRTP